MAAPKMHSGTRVLLAERMVNEGMNMIFRNTLPNGLRIVGETMDNYRSVSIGVWIGAGSIYENSAESGAAHFIEHMLFKGTEGRSAARIA